jgi:hypothetical protein
LSLALIVLPVSRFAPVKRFTKPNRIIWLTPKNAPNAKGDFPVFQCASICPIEGAILNSLGEAINPPGSLTGIPPEKMAEAMAELQSH